MKLTARDLISVLKKTHLVHVVDTTDTVQDPAGSSYKMELGLLFGKVAIFDSEGLPIFYDTLIDAITAASSGDVVEIFADLVEEGIDMKDGVKINGNGHSITGSAGDSIFKANTTSSYTISNLVLKTSDADNSCFINGGTAILNAIFENVIFENDLGNTLNILCSNTNIKGGVSKKGTCYNSGILLNHTSYPLGAFIGIDNLGILDSCNVYSMDVASSNYSIKSSGGKVKGCTAYNLNNTAIYSLAAICENTNGYSENGDGIYADQPGKLINCIGVTLDGIGINALLGVYLYKCYGTSDTACGLLGQYIFGCFGFGDIGITLSTGVDPLEGKLYDSIGHGVFRGATIDSVGYVKIKRNIFIALTVDTDVQTLELLGITAECHIISNDMEAIDGSAYAIYSLVSVNAKITGNTFDSPNGIHANVTQIEIRTADAQGNTFII